MDSFGYIQICVFITIITKEEIMNSRKIRGNMGGIIGVDRGVGNCVQ